MLRKWFEVLLSPPMMGDDKNASAAFLLNAITLWGIPILLLFVSVRVLSGEDLIDTTNVFIGTVILAFVASRFVLQFGYVRVISGVLILFAWLGATYLAWEGDGLQDVTLTAYVTLILISGLLLGEFETLILFLISIAAIWGFAYLDAHGMHPTGTSKNVYVLARDMTLNYFLSTIVVYYMIRVLRRSFDRGQIEIREQKINTNLLRQQATYLSALHETTLGIINRLELRPLLETILAHACELVDVHNGLIELVTPDGSALQLELAIGIPTPYIGHLTYKNEGLTGRVWASKKTQIVNDYSTWEHRDRDVSSDLKGIIGLPLMSGDDVIGILALICVRDERKFVSDQVSLLERFATLASLAIQNAHLYEDVQVELRERRLIQTALLESEEKFRKVFHSSPIAICITTLKEGRLLEANYAYWDLMGLNEDALGKTSDELKLWPTPEEREEFINALLDRGSYYNPDDSFKDEGGNLKRVISFYEIIHIGSEKRILSMFYDMSLLRQTTDALKDSEARMRALLETIPDMILEIAQDGLITNMIPPKGMKESMSAEQVIGRQIREVFPENVTMQTLSAIKDAIASDQTNIFEFVDDRYGEIRTMEARVIASASDTAMMIVRDVTQRKWVEMEREQFITELEAKNREAETLRESTAIIASSLESTEIVQRILEQIQRVVQYDSASVWLYQDDKAFMVGSNGLPPGAELPGQYVINDGEPDYAFWKDNVPYILLDDIQEQYSDFRKPPKNYIRGWLTIPMRVREKLIGFISLDSRVRGKFTRHDAELALTFADQVSIALENARLFSDLQAELTIRKDLISELESKNAELERFTYTVSHDLKSPLFTIRGFLGYLEEDAFAGNHGRLKSDIQRITDATDKMQQLLNELLELSRIGRLKNESEAISFEELARDAVELVQGRIMERGISVHIDADMPV
ncbi:GAF domain-containing protein, partial [Candidatus Bathyarchaeota archaeon]